MTPLRHRMIEDMQIRNLAPETQRAYLQLYKSALDLSGSVRFWGRRAAALMVSRCVADLKPGAFDAPLRGCGA